MKTASSFNCVCSNSRLSIGLLVLLGGSILLVGLAAISKTFAARIGSPQPGSSIPALSSKNDPASNSGPARRLDEQGNRPRGTAFVPLHPHKTHTVRPAGSGAWSSLGPPGGDVFDAAVSTTNPDIVLAGLAPDGSVGGTLYRSSDGGNTW